MLGGVPARGVAPQGREVSGTPTGREARCGACVRNEENRLRQNRGQALRQRRRAHCTPGVGDRTPAGCRRCPPRRTAGSRKSSSQVTPTPLRRSRIARPSRSATRMAGCAFFAGRKSSSTRGGSPGRPPAPIARRARRAPAAFHLGHAHYVHEEPAAVVLVVRRDRQLHVVQSESRAPRWSRRCRRADQGCRPPRRVSFRSTHLRVAAVGSRSRARPCLVPRRRLRGPAALSPGRLCVPRNAGPRSLVFGLEVILSDRSIATRN